MLHKADARKLTSGSRAAKLRGDAAPPQTRVTVRNEDPLLLLQARYGNRYVLRLTGRHRNNGCGYVRKCDSNEGITRLPSAIGISSTIDSSTCAVQRAEWRKQIWGVGPLAAWKARKDAIRARKAAKRSGLPGLRNGPADAFRHAYWNCLMVKSIGYDKAETVARIHENVGKNHIFARIMDDYNNLRGRLAAKSGSCVKAIWTLILNWQLKIIPNYRQVAKSRGRIRPKSPVLYRPLTTVVPNKPGKVPNKPGKYKYNKPGKYKYNKPGKYEYNKPRKVPNKPGKYEYNKPRKYEHYSS